MGCGSCASGSCGAGCGQNGGCATGGCNKLNTYDWLNNMLPPDQTEVDNIYEVRFKNTRKGFYRNVNGLRLFIGDPVVVESDRGYDVGVLSLGGVMAQFQMKKKGGLKPLKDIPRIYRKANENDLELLESVRKREHETMVRTREIINELNLDMKLSDVEFQGDNAKAIFYYIADHRVDFRELIKVLAREFRIRVEMKQIGLRHEAGLVGGIGSCGRELCCSTWLTEFKTVSTSAARYQNLSLNPMKISGLCGRLKCCLNFELDVYMDALEGFPKADSIDTEKGRAFLQKTDIFKGKMWFSYPSETTWYPLTTEEVKVYISLNDAGKKGEALVAKEPAPGELGDSPDFEKDHFDFVDVVGKNVPAPEQKKKGRGGNSQNRRGGNRKNNRQQGSRRQRPSASGNKQQAPGNQQKTEPKAGNGNRQKRAPQGNAQAKSNNRRRTNKPAQQEQKGGNPKSGNPQAKQKRTPNPQNGGAKKGPSNNPQNRRRKPKPKPPKDSSDT
ncbi:regulatory iron-sulfur-containing complex subunit RicT [Pontibacter sp. G13]|uniref:regulatory iron-sulfur-containing complex subunit RicT n=1 Tax=Pontibacter sp. G13 TaxID=3074898 RepID=UPI00288A522F|nr:regulatory iron-sulfur-containing complex subunit RicT [Pontibacter sp. G13]WNJ15992.1 regulatory iron-sulfur-containing complex subunit RicT [Pontibacter sp. G13]